MSLLSELKRRNVFRVAIAYAIVAWLLMQVGDTLAPALRLPEWVPSLVAYILILGFPLAILFAWAYQLTPDGLRPENARAGDSVRSGGGKRPGVAILVVAAVSAAGFFAYQYVDGTNPEAGRTLDARKPVAVLPFENLSADPEQEFFADGLTVELIHLLTEIRELRVTSRASAFYFKDKDPRIADVGRDLNVAYVLEGTVRKHGDQIRVSAQLVDVERDAPIWSQTWQRTFESVFDIQDEIAAAVVRGLQLRLGNTLPETHVTTPEAYALYLRASQLRDDYTQNSLERALNLLEQALEIDPDYVPALVYAGRTVFDLGAWNFRPLEESFARAREYGRRAIEVDPSYNDSYVLLGDLAARFDMEFLVAQQYYERALELDPGYLVARLQLSVLELWKGRTRPHVEAARAWVESDPLSAFSYNIYGHALKFDRQYAAALDAYRKLQALSPDTVAVHSMLGEALYLMERYEDALAVFEQEELEGFRLFGRAIVYHQLGRSAESDAAVAALIAMDNEEWAAQIAQAHAVRGETDEAIRWLYLGLERHDQGIQIAKVNPFLDNLHGDSRFEEFLDDLLGTHHAL